MEKPPARQLSKSRLSKQDEIEEVEEEDTSPNSENSDATIVPTVSVESPGPTPESGSPEEPKSPPGGLPSQQSTDSDLGSPTSTSNPKVKLLQRSQALRDDASPPPEDVVPASTAATSATTFTTATVTMATAIATLTVASVTPKGQRRGGKKHSLEKENSGDSSTSPCLSRNSSTESPYTDSTGIDLEEFIKMTLNKNPKDRMFLMKLEQDLVNFINDNEHQYLKFPQMTSYHRMLVHRVAAFFGLDHNVDQSGKCVIVNHTTNTRIPDFKFSDHTSKSQGSQEEQPKKQILKRQDNSLEDGRGDQNSLADKKSKSLEEREDEYQRARERIFNQSENCSQSSQDQGSLESPMNGSRGSSTKSSSIQSSKVHIEELRWTEGSTRPWSSTDSSGYGTDTSAKHKLSMTKASSFGGRTNRSFSKTESVSSGASGLSGMSGMSSPMPRSSNIASSPPVSQLSESSSSGQSATSPQPHADCLVPGSLPPLTSFNVEGLPPMAIWVASSPDVIPQGSIIINPQTGKPYRNPDGSLYHYHPQVPVAVPATMPHQPLLSHVMAPATLPTPQESSGGDLSASQQLSQLSLAPTPSQESLTPEPNQQQLYVLPPGGPQQHYMQAQQQQSTYIQQNQVPYSANGQVRYMCPSLYQAQAGSMTPGGDVPGQIAQAGTPNGQFPSQYQGYSVVGMPNMTVTAIEYTPPTYQGHSIPAEGTYSHYQQGAPPNAAPLYISSPPGSEQHPLSFQTVNTSMPGSGQAYRPRTPPSQPAQPPGSLPIGVGQAIPMGQPVSGQVYPYGSGYMAPRQATPQVAAPNMPGVQSYVVRPGVAQTTPPPAQPQQQYTQVAVVSAPRQVLVDQRMPAPGEGVKTLAPSSQLPLVGVPSAGIRPPMPVYRSQTQLSQGEVRLLGQPIQQFPRPQQLPPTIIPMVARPRAPIANGQVNNRQRLRKPSREDSSGPSPHNSTESMESSDSAKTLTATGN